MSTFALACRVLAVTVLIAALLSAADGSASRTGRWVRRALEAPLGRIRARSSLTTVELADACVWAAIASSALAVIVDRALMPIVLAAALWLCRPALIELVSRRSSFSGSLPAGAGPLSADFLIGIFAPVGVAQMLLGSFHSGSAFLFTMVALAWPGTSHVRVTRRAAFD